MTEARNSNQPLPGIEAFSQRALLDIYTLDAALTDERIRDAANACHMLMDELEAVRDRLVDLMAAEQ